VFGYSSRGAGAVLPSITGEIRFPLPIIGAIRDKWAALGGAAYFGRPVTAEVPTFDGVGRTQRFLQRQTAPGMINLPPLQTVAIPGTTVVISVRRGSGSTALVRVTAYTPPERFCEGIPPL
jgi:hypothetical protein